MSEYSMLNALMTPGLTPNESRVYTYLVGRANGAKVCWPTVNDIAADLKMSRRAVIDATTELHGHDADPAKGTVFKPRLIEVRRRYRQSNNYVVVDMPGLYDRPTYADSKRSSGPFSWSNGVEVQIPAHHSPERDPAVQVPAHQSDPEPAVGCKIEHSEVQIPAPPLVHQEREQSSSSAHARASGGARDLAAAEGVANAPRIIPARVWSAAKEAWVEAPQPRHRNPFIEAMRVMGSPGANGDEAINGFDVRGATLRACAEARIDPAQAMGDQSNAVRTWLHAGIEPSQVFSAIRRCVLRAGYTPPFSLGWFDKPVQAEAARSRRRYGAGAP